MPAVTKKQKASNDEVMHGTKGKKMSQKDLKKQMKNAASKSPELVIDSSDVNDATMKMGLLKEDSSDFPMAKESREKNAKSLFIDVPYEMDIKEGQELVTAIKDGITPMFKYITLGFNNESSARAAEEQLGKVDIDSKAVNTKLIEGRNKDKKSLFVELQDMEIEKAQQFVAAVEASGSELFTDVTLYFKEKIDAIASKELLRKSDFIERRVRLEPLDGALIKDKKSLFIEMPEIIEVENAKQFLPAIEASGAQLFKYLTIILKQEEEAIAAQKRLSKVEIEGKATHVEFDHRTPMRDRKSLFIQEPDTMEIENYRQFLTALETSSNPVFQYLTIVHNEEDDAKSTHERLSSVKIDGRPLVMDM